MLKPYLEKLLQPHDLTVQEITDAFNLIMQGKVNHSQIAALLIALRLKGETSSEIQGAALAMRQHMRPLHLNSSLIFDTCGTGGDHQGLFNISTAVALILAALKITVAKHGNRAVSSQTGSADILAALGLELAPPDENLQVCLERLHFGFLFAPKFHPAMKYAAPVRQELGLRTIFNLLGPLTNPAGATHQLVGVFAQPWLKPLATVLRALGGVRGWVVHSADGFDELSINDLTYVVAYTPAGLNELTINPQTLGIKPAPLAELQGGDAASNAVLLKELLSGQAYTKAGTPKATLRALLQIISLNAGAALLIAERVATLQEGIKLATEVLSNGRAYPLIADLVKLTNSTVHYH